MIIAYFHYRTILWFQRVGDFSLLTDEAMLLYRPAQLCLLRIKAILSLIWVAAIKVSLKLIGTVSSVVNQLDGVNWSFMK